LTGIRGTIAERLWMSTQATARAVLFTKVDMSQVNAWREDLKQQGHSVSINSLMVAVVAKALTEFPPFNARIENREIQLIEEINIGVAVDTARGLLVPTIRRANQRGVISIDLDLKEKVERAKAGKAGLEDLSGGTFTITNLGMFGVEAFIPIINPPEAAILALGEVEKKQVILDDNSVVIKPMVRLSLVWDHRLNDGAPAARFLQRIKELMEKPMGLMS
jgi:pyruvate dehydrogenase E2 component (dihydrolipoyllysine-residue acetyltransferase)